MQSKALCQFWWGSGCRILALDAESPWRRQTAMATDSAHQTQEAPRENFLEASDTLLRHTALPGGQLSFTVNSLLFIIF